MKKPDWLEELTNDVREASKAFGKYWPDAWLYLGNDSGSPEDGGWYDWPDPLLGLPVLHCPAWLRHSGHDGEHQRILPLWKGDVSGKTKMIREFEARLEKSGDF